MQMKATDYEAKDIIKILREWTNLKQEDFCKIINRSPRSLQAYESGETKYSVDMLLDICRKNNIVINIEKNF